MLQTDKSKIEFDCLGQESRYLHLYSWNQTRIENDHFRFLITGQETCIQTIKIPFRNRNKIFSDTLLDDKRESKNEIQDFKRRNIKNRERIMTIHP